MYPFYYFPKIKINPQPIKKFIESVPEEYWRGQGFQEYITKEINPNRKDAWCFWTLLQADYDLLQCPEIAQLVEGLNVGSKKLWYTLNIKRSRNGYQSEWRPLMQHPEFDKLYNIKRTWDIIVPIQGGFVESPLEAYDTENDEYHTLVPKGQAFMVPTDPRWHYRWKETKYDFRYTVHIRGKLPTTYEYMKTYEQLK
jgi:hypothetical protein